ncbi:hypothetical protein K504DRAFT_502617 [Pleomassaria siparia CBS 279.74]|uniref:Uncharacterized protein n=1 Tax=Pleomassaria siparia CBS 279.74 TaxID=1314801 RepID=A0A6G1K740_9PLEO|nr:hypothetical protein K504DRAFT_502617 [Pleomassaria siparia CBS 279.74]
MSCFVNRPAPPSEFVGRKPFPEDAGHQSASGSSNYEMAANTVNAQFLPDPRTVITRPSQCRLTPEMGLPAPTGLLSLPLSTPTRTAATPSISHSELIPASNVEGGISTQTSIPTLPTQFAIPTAPATAIAPLAGGHSDRQHVLQIILIAGIVLIILFYVLGILLLILTWIRGECLPFQTLTPGAPTRLLYGGGHSRHTDDKAQLKEQKKKKCEYEHKMKKHASAQLKEQKKKKREYERKMRKHASALLNLEGGKKKKKGTLVKVRKWFRGLTRKKEKEDFKLVDVEKAYGNKKASSDRLFTVGDDEDYNEAPDSFTPPTLHYPPVAYVNHPRPLGAEEAAHATEQDETSYSIGYPNPRRDSRPDNVARITFLPRFDDHRDSNGDFRFTVNSRLPRHGRDSYSGHPDVQEYRNLAQRAMITENWDRDKDREDSDKLLKKMKED